VWLEDFMCDSGGNAGLRQAFIHQGNNNVREQMCAQGEYL
jgi:hypothetical protein